MKGAGWLGHINVFCILKVAEMMKIFCIDATYEMRTTEYGEICISIDNQTSAEKAF
jgi:hypothetical protein